MAKPKKKPTILSLTRALRACERAGAQMQDRANAAERAIHHPTFDDVVAVVHRWRRGEVERLAGEALAHLAVERSTRTVSDHDALNLFDEWTAEVAENTWPLEPNTDGDTACYCSDFHGTICPQHASPRVNIGVDTDGEAAFLWLASTKWSDPTDDDSAFKNARNALRRDVMHEIERRAAEWRYELNDDRNERHNKETDQ